MKALSAKEGYDAFNPALIAGCADPIYYLDWPV
jgi:hypothetical protein